MNEVDAARLTTWGAYLRPVAAVMAGLLADRFDSARAIVVAFGLLVAAYGVLATTSLDTGSMTLLMSSLLVTFAAVYALRGIYYALLEETRTPKHLTGASVAVIAFVGYTPEIFFGPVTGRILDASPGVAGHLDYFVFLTAMASAGIVVARALAVPAGAG